jgi:hypothetical protein
MFVYDIVFVIFSINDEINTKLLVDFSVMPMTALSSQSQKPYLINPWHSTQ